MRPFPNAHARVAGLDLIRGVAIGLVLFRHGFIEAGGDTIAGMTGAVGVVMFFALSGYLITGLLVTDIRRFGHVRYRRFYRNRILRLYPPLLLFTAAVVTVSWTANPGGDRDSLLRTVVTALTYTTDLPIDNGSTATDHLWTLATEEQFYLLWPLVLFVSIRTRKLLLMVVLAGVAILLGLLGTLAWFHGDVERIYGLPTSWAIAMVIGSAGRLCDIRISAAFVRIGLGKVAIACTALLLVLALMPEAKGSWTTYVFLGPAAALATVGIIFYVREWAQIPSLVWLPVSGLGRISYAAYLWNYGIVVWLGGMGMPFSTGWLSVALTVGAALTSWYLIERPIERLKFALDQIQGSSVAARRPRNQTESGGSALR